MHSSTATCIIKVPCFTFSLSFAESPGNPLMCFFDLRGGPAKAIYKELTGDESSDPTSEEKIIDKGFHRGITLGIF